MSNRNKLTNSTPVHQNRSAAGSASGSKAQIGFASVNPVQKKDDPAQLQEEDETASLKADPAQLNQLEEEVK